MPAASRSAGPAGTGAPVDPHEYIIGPEDVLAITVWRQPDLSRQVVVRPDGKITLPLLNEVVAAGLTPDKLTQVLTDGWSKLYTHPDVSVAVQAVNSKRYFIQGEVMKPGPYPLVVPTTVLEALVNAGGFRDFANPKKIVILRIDNGKTERLKFNYKEVTKGKNMQQNVLVRPGDQIIVP